MIRRVAPLRFCTTACVLLTVAAHADLIWFDGARDESDAPPGKLLSDNEGYWGDCILTGVDYRYEVEPNSPADTWRDKRDRFGRRLLDGRPSGNWWVPVGVSGRPLTVTFDFKRPCVFTEIDVATRSRKVAIKLECSDAAEGDWRVVFERSRDECPDQSFHRLPIPGKPEGRYLRLHVAAESTAWVAEVLVWGDAEVSEEHPEDIKPLSAPLRPSADICYQSFRGVTKSAITDAQFFKWQADLGEAADAPAVWSRVPTWDAITDRALLPTGDEIIRQVPVMMARNETECVALALTNTSWTERRSLNLRLSEFRHAGSTTPVAGITGELRIAGIIPSRTYDRNVGPLLAADNMPGKSLMRRYLSNGADIADFPRIALPLGGSSVVWLSVTTDGAPPGHYEARLSYRGGPPVMVRARVADVTLPSPFVWLQTWSRTTSMFPFTYDDRRAREVAYKQSLGVTVWNGFPTDGSVAALAREGGRTIFHIWGIGDYGHQLYGGRIDPEKLTAEDEQAIAERIRGHVKQAEELGLSYDDWYVELTDEPGPRNAAGFGALCRLIRKADPKVRIYCNPSFWTGWDNDGCAEDEVVSSALAPWYNDCVDISCPLWILLDDRPRAHALFESPRFVRASYDVSTQSAKSERRAQIEPYRRYAWDAFSRGWNGWGFYSYYAPRGNPWDDMDASWIEDLPDYLMVYPGPRGPIPTRQSEAVREGWEDYCLLTLLRQRGMDVALRPLLQARADGEALEELRARALTLAAAEVVRR